MKLRFLALYVNKHGGPAAAMLSGDAGQLPFGVDEFSLGLPDYDGEPVTLVEMPNDESFRPTVVDIENDAEVALGFVDLPAELTAPDEV